VRAVVPPATRVDRAVAADFPADRRRAAAQLGGEFIFKDARTWGVPDAETKTVTTRYGTAHARG
jgi:hypothetical protein